MRSIKDILGSVAIGIMIGIILFECLFALKLFSDANGNDNNIDVEIEEGETSVVEFEELGLVPGQSVEYELYLSTGDGPTQCISLDFYETGDSPLKDYVRVTIFLNDEEICDELLGDVMDAGNIVCNADISSGEHKITLVYYMPEEVGNEAAGAEAWFDLFITAQFMQ